MKEERNEFQSVQNKKIYSNSVKDMVKQVEQPFFEGLLMLSNLDRCSEVIE